jgi:hypothetical protein
MIEQAGALDLPVGAVTQKDLDKGIFPSEWFEVEGNTLRLKSEYTLNVLKDLLLGGNLTLTGDGAITGNVTVAGTLAVTGASTLTGDTTVGSTLRVTGALTPTGGIVWRVIDSATIDTKIQNLAHSIGALPKFWQWVLLCVSADQGYSAGDEGIFCVSYPAGDRNISASVDATYFNTAVDNTGGYIQHKTTGLGCYPTLTKWKIRLKYLP